MTKENKIVGAIAFVAGILLTATVLIVVASFVMPGGIPNGPTPPVPAVVTQVKRAVIVYESDKRTIGNVLIYDGPQSRALLDKGLLQFVEADDDKTHDGKDFVTAKGYKPLIDAAGSTPCVLFVAEDGSVGYSARIPANEAEWQALCNKHLTGCPPPVQLVKAAPRVVSRGGDLEFDGDNVIVGGQRRALTFKPNAPKFGATKAFSDKNPIFPPSTWRVIDRSYQFGKTWIKNQGQIGSCVAQSAVGGYEELRYLLGMSRQELSAIFNYAHFHGGRDAGGAIVDGPEMLAKYGTCKKATLPEKFTLKSQITPAMYKEAENFKLTDYYRCNGPLEAMSAVQALYPITACVMVGKNFNHFSDEGLVGFDSGPGNHAVHCIECVRLKSGKMAWRFRNSWGDDWGPFGDGTFLADEHTLYGGGRMQECIALRLSNRTVLDHNEPPAYAPKKPAGPIADPPLALAF